MCATLRSLRRLVPVLFECRQPGFVDLGLTDQTIEQGVLGVEMGV